MFHDYYSYKTGENLNQEQQQYRDVVLALQSESLSTTAALGFLGFDPMKSSDGVLAMPLSELTGMVVVDSPAAGGKDASVQVAMGRLTHTLLGYDRLNLHPSDRGWVDLMKGPQQPRQPMELVNSATSILAAAPTKVLVANSNGDLAVYIDTQVAGNPTRVCVAVIPPGSLRQVMVCGQVIQDLPEYAQLVGEVTSKSEPVVSFTKPVKHHRTLMHKGEYYFAPPEKSAVTGADEFGLVKSALLMREHAKWLLAEKQVAAVMLPIRGSDFIDLQTSIGHVPKQPEVMFRRLHAGGGQDAYGNVVGVPVLSPVDGVVTAVDEFRGIVTATVENEGQEQQFRYPADLKIDVYVGRELVADTPIGTWQTALHGVVRTKESDILQWMANDYANHGSVPHPEDPDVMLVPASRVKYHLTMRDKRGELVPYLAVHEAYYSYEHSKVVLPAFDYRSDAMNGVFEGLLSVTPEPFVRFGTEKSAPKRIKRDLDQLLGSA